MNKNILITEISEEDFRKLDLKAYHNERKIITDNISGRPTVRFEMTECSLNERLDREIEACLSSGLENDLEDLKCPVTIAIHEPDGYYLDKFMNRFTGSQTFQIGWGIKHLYSTRDYFEAHDDYWKVRKDETKVIYRVHLDEKWANQFELKYKVEKIPQSEDGSEWIEVGYKLVDGSWVETTKCRAKKHGQCTYYEPILKDE